MNYIRSEDIKVYPCAYRGKDGSNNQFDIESRLMTEHNYTSIAPSLSKESYVISAGTEKSTESVVILSIAGYRFEIKRAWIEDDHLKYLDDTETVSRKIAGIYVKDVSIGAEGTANATTTSILYNIDKASNDESTGNDFNLDGKDDKNVYRFYGLGLAETTTSGEFTHQIEFSEYDSTSSTNKGCGTKVYAGDIDTTKAMVFNSGLSSVGLASFSGNVNITRSTTIGDTLTVDGLTTLDGGAKISKSLEVSTDDDGGGLAVAYDGGAGNSITAVTGDLVVKADTANGGGTLTSPTVKCSKLGSAESSAPKDIDVISKLYLTSSGGLVWKGSSIESKNYYTWYFGGINSDGSGSYATLDFSEGYPTNKTYTSIYFGPNIEYIDDEEDVALKYSTLGVNGTAYFAGEAVFKNGVQVTGGISASGTITAANFTTSGTTGKCTASAFYATSDARKKENIEGYSCERSILDLPVKKFDFIGGEKSQIGCLAQDLMEICPEIVHEGEDGYLTIQESKIVYLLLNEVKELKREVEELKASRKCD